MQQQEKQEAEIYPLKSRDFEPLESTFGDVTKNLRDVALLSHEQRETVKAIESNAENARVRVELGLGDMRLARRNRSEQRKKRICFLFFLLSIVSLSTLIGVIVWATMWR